MKDTDKILSYLADEESKFIYQKKVEYSETGNFEPIKEIVDRYLPQFRDRQYYPGIENNMLEMLKGKTKIIIFGSGLNGKYLLDFLMSHKVSVQNFVDNNSSRWGQHIKGVEIKDPQAIDYRNVEAIIISPYEQIFVEQMHKQIAELKIDNSILLLDYRDYCPIMLEYEQYFDANIVKLHEDEVFIDAGVLNLYTSIRFAEECRKNRIKNFKIHAFEPDYVSYQRCREIQKNMPDIDLKLYHEGLWCENATLHFTEMGNGSSRITQQGASASIKCVSLDNCVKDKVTFIKMDIEGAELEALKGSKEIIKRYKPKLAICIYHKKEDLTEIPVYIKSLVPEYKLYIRHYSNATGETVLYAVL